jgi:hypothetical protein
MCWKQIKALEMFADMELKSEGTQKGKEEGWESAAIMLEYYI